MIIEGRCGYEISLRAGAGLIDFAFDLLHFLGASYGDENGFPKEKEHLHSLDSAEIALWTHSCLRHIIRLIPTKLSSDGHHVEEEIWFEVH